MTDPTAIQISDYDYQLPPLQIAQFPLEQRDASRLLIFKDGNIQDGQFSSIDRFLPVNSHLVFNDTRVIRARLLFQKPTGGQVEVFCLEPLRPVSEIQKAFLQTSGCEWKCLVGNLKRWKSGSLMKDSMIGTQSCHFSATRVESDDDGCQVIRFQWEPTHLTFSEVLERIGKIPLPPYINRESDGNDADRYQTIFAQQEGSVAAPTAGLHFTPALLEKITSGHRTASRVTLHVGMGTFKPVTASIIRDHVMHHEQIMVQRKTIEALISRKDQPVFAVGTTSARTLESLYWLGVQMIQYGTGAPMVVEQWMPYRSGNTPAITSLSALETILRYLDDQNLEELTAETRLMIVPGYRFRIVSGLITNFHMPQSTLLLMIAALIGPEWKRVYKYALENGFRFLSYGDACLFFPSSDNCL